jgi:endonuclease YncB( thermonuclease family)
MWMRKPPVASLPNKRLRLPRLLIGGALLLCGMLGLWLNRPNDAATPHTVNATSVKTCLVMQVFDGDTFSCDVNGNGRVDGKREHVRLLGIDTPETAHSRKSRLHRNAPLALEAQQWLVKQLTGQRVTLVYDVRPTDKYHRQLAHVFLPGQKRSVNEQLLSLGYARLLFIAPNALNRQAYETALHAAQQARRGLWQ